MSRLENKVVLITGAGMGIGAAAALAMSEEGATVAVADINDEAGRATADAISTTGGTASFHHADVSQLEDVQNTVKAVVNQYGRIDVLVNNAAVPIRGTVTETSEEDWAKVLATNLTSVWRFMKFTIPHMIAKGGGSIVNISSVNGMMGFHEWAAYATAKGGVTALTVQSAVDYAEHGIRVNGIAPGTIMTPLNEKVFAEAEDADALIATWSNRHALGRFGQPEEVAKAIVFLASDESSFITGEILRVDGGIAIKGD